MKTRINAGRKLKARYLIVVKGYSQKEAAKIVGVSQKTMVVWVRKYKWNHELTKDVNKEGGSVSVEHLKTITSLWHELLKSHEKQIE